MGWVKHGIVTKTNSGGMKEHVEREIGNGCRRDFVPDANELLYLGGHCWKEG